VIASRDEGQATLLSPKNQAELETGPAFEIVSPKPANAQTRMKVRLAESVADRVDCFCHFAPA
jgi:hypothetical protein